MLRAKSAWVEEKFWSFPQEKEIARRLPEKLGVITAVQHLTHRDRTGSFQSSSDDPHNTSVQSHDHFHFCNIGLNDYFNNFQLDEIKLIENQYIYIYIYQYDKIIKRGE